VIVLALASLCAPLQRAGAQEHAEPIPLALPIEVDPCVPIDIPSFERQLAIELEAAPQASDLARAEASARVALGCSGEQIAVHVSDSRARRTWRRRIDLRGVDARTHTRLLALSVAELLLASWLELRIDAETRSKRRERASSRSPSHAHKERTRAPAQSDAGPVRGSPARGPEVPSAESIPASPPGERASSDRSSPTMREPLPVRAAPAPSRAQGPGPAPSQPSAAGDPALGRVSEATPSPSAAAPGTNEPLRATEDPARPPQDPAAAAQAAAIDELEPETLDEPEAEPHGESVALEPAAARPRPALQLGAAGQLLSFTSALSAVPGGELHVIVPLSAAWALRGGAQGGYGSLPGQLATESTSVRITTASLALSLGWVARSGGFELSLAAGVRAGLVHLAGTPTPAGVPTARDWAPWAGPLIAPAVSYALSARLRLALGLEAGLLAVRVRATALTPDERVVSELHGPWLLLNLGLDGAFFP